MKFTLRVTLSLLFFVNLNTLSAQNDAGDSSQLQSATQSTIALYYDQLADQSPLFNGSLYAGYGYKFISGSPYFLTEKFSMGTIMYSGVYFDSVLLLYDDLKQLLVLDVGTYPLQLVSERISEFSVAGHEFVHLYTDSLKIGIAKTGFYEILYPGRTEVLKWTTKNTQSKLSIVEGDQRFIEESDTYFFKVGGIYHRVKSKGEFLDLMKDHKKDVQRFMKKNSLNFRKDTDNTIIQTTGYYDQLAK